MAFTGMDPAVVRDIGHRLKAQASDIGTIVATIDRLVQQSAGIWDGAKSRQFQNSWQGDYRPALRRAQQSLNGLGQSALNNVTEQEQASGGGVGAGAAAGASTASRAAAAEALAGASAVVGALFKAAESSVSFLSTGEFGAKFATLLNHQGSLRNVSWGDASYSRFAAIAHNADHSLSGFRSTAGFSKFLGGAGVVMGAASVAYDIASGNVSGDTWITGANTAFGSAALAFPPLELPAAAFGVGTAIGYAVADIPAVHAQLDNWSDAAFSQAMNNAGGDAHAVAERYSGVTGPLHFAEDSVSAGWNKIVSFF